MLQPTGSPAGQIQALDLREVLIHALLCGAGNFVTIIVAALTTLHYDGFTGLLVSVVIIVGKFLMQWLSDTTNLS